MTTDSGCVPTASPPSVSSELQRALDTCTSQLLSRHPAVVHEFHRRMLSVAPAVANMVGGGRPMSQRTVMAALENAQPSLRPAAPAAVVQQVGQDNYLEGFPDTHLGTVTNTMLHAIRTVIAEEWSSLLSSAWVQYLMWFQAHLQLGAQRQRDRDVASGDRGAYSQTAPAQGARQQPRPVPGPYPTPATGPGGLRPHQPERSTPDRRTAPTASKPEGPPATAIDKIIIKDGGTEKTLTPAQWKALPFAERVKHLSANPRFYAGTQQIGTKEAITLLRG